MNIDDLILLHKRATEFIIAKAGYEPDYIRLNEDGTMTSVYDRSVCGDREEDHELINIDNLTSDLDAVRDSRLQKEHDERVKQMAWQKELNRRAEEQAKEDRRRKYLELKKEFES